MKGRDKQQYRANLWRLKEGCKKSKGLFIMRVEVLVACLGGLVYLFTTMLPKTQNYMATSPEAVFVSSS